MYNIGISYHHTVNNYYINGSPLPQFISKIIQLEFMIYANIFMTLLYIIYNSWYGSEMGMHIYT